MSDFDRVVLSLFAVAIWAVVPAVIVAGNLRRRPLPRLPKGNRWEIYLEKYLGGGEGLLILWKEENLFSEVASAKVPLWAWRFGFWLAHRRGTRKLAKRHRVKERMARKQARLEKVTEAIKAHNEENQ